MRNEDGFITNHLPYAIVAKKEHAVTEKKTISYFSFLISYAPCPTLLSTIIIHVKTKRASMEKARSRKHQAAKK